jgi:hypothetical protein
MNTIEWYVKTFGRWLRESKTETDTALIMVNLIHEIRQEERRRAGRIAEKAADEITGLPVNQP